MMKLKIVLLGLCSAFVAQSYCMHESVEVGQTADPLITAILSENYEGVCNALEKNQNPNYYHETTQYTPLSLACASGKMEIVQALLAKGAGTDYQLYDEQNRPLNTTALTEAARHGHLDIAKELICHGANPNPRNPDNFTPLHAAARNGNPDIVRLLIKCKAKLNARTEFEGVTPLHESIPDLTQGQPDKELERKKYQASLLILQARARPNIKTLYHTQEKHPRTLQDKTALMLAATRGKLLHVHLLLLFGANPNIPDRFNAMPLEQPAVRTHFTE